MKDMIPLIAASVICTAILTAVFCALPFFREKAKATIKKSAVFAAASVIVLLIFGYVTDAYAYLQQKPSLLSIIAATAVCYLGFAASGLIERENLKKFVRRSGVICLVLIIAESTLFNFKSYTSDTNNYIVPFSSAQTNTSNTVEIFDDCILFKNDGSFYFDLGSENITAVQLKFEGSDHKFRCGLAIKDENFSETFITTGQKMTSCDYGKCDFSFIPYGKLKSVQITLNDIESNVKISSCMFNTAIPFRFSNLRFLFLLLFCILVCMVITFRLYKVEYNSSSKKQRAVIGLVLILSAGFMINLYIPEQELIDYETVSVTDSVADSDPYVQTFDAIYNGRNYLDIEPTPELLAMENPYDISAREVSGVYYKWDRAFYNGKYYSFYGMTPVLLYYFPFYFISGGYLPTINMASLFFGILSVIFMFGAILTFLKRFNKSPNFMLLILALLGASFTTGIYYLVDYSNIYTLPGITSTCFLFLSLWLGFSACSQKSAGKQAVQLIFCGVAFALCFEARATKALSALMLAPLFIGIILNKDYNIKRKVGAAASFLIPVAIGLSAVMMYNNARFDSPLEFGPSYQLTVSNVNANTLEFSLIPFALAHFFLQPLSFTGTFPFIDINFTNFSNYGKYAYTDASAGLITYPVLFAAILILPFLLYHNRRKKGEKYVYNNDRIRNYTYLLMLVLIMGISWFNFCTGGIIIRYIIDILPITTLLSIFVMLDTQKLVSNTPALAGKTAFAFSALQLATITIIFVQLPILYEAAISKHSPELISVLEDIVCFWN